MYDTVEEYLTEYRIICDYVQQLAKSNNELSKKIGQQIRNEITITEECNRLHKELQLCKKERDSLLLSNSTLQKEIEYLGRKVKKADNDLSVIHRLELEDIKKKHDSLIYVYEQEKLSQCDRIQQQSLKISNLDKTCYDLKEELARERLKSQHLIDKVRECENKSCKLEVQLNDLAGSNKGLKLEKENLLCWCNKMESEKKETAEELIQSKNAARQFQSKLNEAVMKIEESVNTAEMAVAEKRQLQNKLSKLESELTETRHRTTQEIDLTWQKQPIISVVEKYTRHHYNQLEIQNNALKNEVKQLHNEMKLMKENHKSKEPYVNDSCPKCSNDIGGTDKERLLSSKLVQVERNYDNMNLNYIQQINDLKDCCKGHEKAVVILKTDRDDLLKQKELAENKIAQTTQKNRELSEQIDHLTKKTDDLETSLSLLKISHQQELSIHQQKLKAKCDDLKDEMDAQQYEYLSQTYRLKTELANSKLLANTYLDNSKSNESNQKAMKLRYEVELQKEKSVSQYLRNDLKLLNNKLKSMSLQMYSLQERLKAQEIIIQSSCP